MTTPAKTQVLGLYKQLLRYGQNLTFTDKTYFKNRIKSEFIKSRGFEDVKDIEFQFSRGQALLERKRVV